MPSLACLADGEDDSLLRTSEQNLIPRNRTETQSRALPQLLSLQQRPRPPSPAVPGLAAAASLPDDTMASLVDACLVFLVDGDAPSLVQHAEAGAHDVTLCRCATRVCAPSGTALFAHTPLAIASPCSRHRRRSRCLRKRRAQGLPHLLQGECRTRFPYCLMHSSRTARSSSRSCSNRRAPSVRSIIL